MSDFDPYLKWLGIRETTRPINHYRLLGLDLFESDPDVISMAADRQMTHVRTYQGGPNGAASQQLLNELARARRCLLVADKKFEYDAQLRAESATTKPASVPPPIIKVVTTENADSIPAMESQPSVDPGSNIGIQADVDARAKTKKRESKQLVWTIASWISGGLAAVGVSAWIINSGLLSNFKPVENEVAAEHQGSVSVSEDPASGTKGNSASVPDTDGKMAANETPPENDIETPPVVENPIAVQPPRKVETVESTSNNNSLPNIFDLAPKSTEVSYDLTNLESYPKPKGDAFRLIGKVKQEVRNGKTVPLGVSSQVGGSDEYSVVPENGALLIGLAVSTTNELLVSAIQPIFYDGLRAGVGEAVPAAEPDSSCLIAKPGYAIGELQISAIQPINCVRIKFMKIVRDRLDPHEYYFSKWHGREVGPIRTITNQRGLPVVGIFGRTDRATGLASLGLIGMDPLAKPPAKETTFFPDSKPDATNDPFEAKPDTSKPVVKLPEPSSRERSAAEKNIPESIQVTIAEAKGVRGTMYVAQQLVSISDNEQDPALKYVVLEEAIRLSVSVGDAKTAIAALREIDQNFEIEFWKVAEKTLEKAARNPQDLTAIDFKETMDELIEEAKNTGHYDEAGKLLADAIGFSKRAKDADSTEQYERLRKEIQELERLKEESVKAIAILSTNPEDPGANLDQGNYLFVMEDDVDGATKHWQKSNHKDLVRLANAELGLDESDAVQVAALADQWYALGKSDRTALDRKCLDRAYELYKQALRNLNGLAKQSVTYKLSELRKILRD